MKHTLTKYEDKRNNQYIWKCDCGKFEKFVKFIDYNFLKKPEDIEIKLKDQYEKHLKENDNGEKDE